MIRKFIKSVASFPLLLRVSAKSRYLSVLYYLFFSRSFGREQQAVLNGRLKYLESRKGSSHSRYFLRRNIHRLEKGLLMKPRRSVFGLEYISDTVTCYKQVAATTPLNASTRDELQWAHDVLEKYFSVTDLHPIIEEAKFKFSANGSLYIQSSDYSPYKRNLKEPVPVTYDAFCKLALRRRSVRWYLPKPVPRELIDQAIHIARLSPSACNRQPFHFYVFDEPELVQKMATLPMGTAGFSHNFPAIVVIAGQLRAYLDERDRHLIYIDGSLAAMSFMLALETLNLSSCPINWPDIESREQKMAKFLKLDDDERVLMLISIGYPDPEGMVAYSQKRSLNEIRSYNAR